MMSEPVSHSAEAQAVPQEGETVLTVKDLVVQFKVEGEYVTAVDGLSYELRRGETLGIVGESGSGKSVTNLAVMGLLPIPPGRVPQGEILFEGQDLLKASKAQLRRIRGNKIAMIFQDPMTSLNPFLKVSTQLLEVLNQHRRLPKDKAYKMAFAMMQKVGIPDVETRFHQYPHEFSGGMRQRVMIAMMLLNNPEVLIADEPTTALDVTIQAQILDLLKDLQKEFNTAITLITHDLGVVAEMSDHVLVMYSGKTMEAAPTGELFENPTHPYTLGLLKSIPSFDSGEGDRLYSIPGRPPDLNKRPHGCPFAPRCRYVKDKCREAFPEETLIGENHRVYCWSIAEVQADQAKEAGQ
jgi:oligopeptide/dipeptide ABC transporter ATP-binding protein